MSDLLFKDCTDVWNRLFDHRPFLKGEINYFIKEFEEKRQNREETRLDTIAEKITDIKDKLDKAHNHQEIFTKIPTLISTALQNCETILESEGNIQPEPDIETRRAARLKKWEAHLSEMENKYSSLDASLIQQEKEIEEYFKELDQKLNLPSTS